MTLHLHHLKGCAPAPLANYLKALGVLRLLAEQGADRNARGWWQDEHFCILTTLSRGDIDTFFIQRYEPTPLLSPWNKGSGFFSTDDPGLTPLEQSKAARFARFRAGIADSRRLLDVITEADSVIRALKARTKTNKAFQSDEQRDLLKKSELVRAFIDELRERAKAPTLSPAATSEIRQEIATVESFLTSAKVPSKAEADAIKKMPVYKRLVAAAERRFQSLKATLIPDCRLLWRGPHAQWLAAAVVLDEQSEPHWPSLLGTGGNDGRLDFTNNFMQRIGDLFEVEAASGHPLPATAELLANALWSEPTDQLGATAIGQFQPGSAGGANSSTGTLGNSLVNPWDFVLTMEGSVLFSARASRRLDPNGLIRASAPFAVHSHAAGFASPGAEKTQRGEQWMPLWSRPANLADIVALFSDGRLQLNRQTANRPVDVARAISRLGVARGIQRFTRYGYLERNGQSTLAVPLGTVDVPERPRPRTQLIDDLATWMDRLQRQAKGKTASSRLIQAERRLADAVIAALTHDFSFERWQLILRTAAAIEVVQASGTAVDAGPIPRLSPEWVAAVNDETAEVRLALALGSAAAAFGADGAPLDPVRHHWLPLEPGARRFKVVERRLARDSRVIMSGCDLVTDSAALVNRRLIEAELRGERRLPLVAARGCDARLDDLAIFLSGAVDFQKIYELARAFMAIQWNGRVSGQWPAAPATNVKPDEAWIALRLASLPWDLSRDKAIPAEPNIVRRLLGGDSAGAVAIALRRLRSAGIRPPLQAAVTDGSTARRWAAALAFPIDRRTAFRAAIILDPSLKEALHARSL